MSVCVHCQWHLGKTRPILTFNKRRKNIFSPSRQFWIGLDTVTLTLTLRPYSFTFSIGDLFKTMLVFCNWIICSFINYWFVYASLCKKPIFHLIQDLTTPFLALFPVIDWDTNLINIWVEKHLIIPPPPLPVVFLWPLASSNSQCKSTWHPKRSVN